MLFMVISLFSACAEEEEASETSQVVATDAGVSQTEEAEATEVTFDGEILIGVILSLTGEAASNHTKAKAGIELACEEINAAGGVLGKEVVLQIEDEQTTPDGAVLVASKLYGTEMVALLGPNRTAHTTAILEQIDEGEIPCICWSTSPTITAENTHEWLFFGRPSDCVTAANAATFMVETLGCTKIGIFYNNDDYGVGCKDVFVETCESLGVEYELQGHNSSDKDFSGQIVAFQSAGCDGVTSWGHVAETAIFARQRVEYSLDVPYLGSASITDSSCTDLLDAEVVDGVYSVCDAAPDATDEVMQPILEKCEELNGYSANVMYMAAHSSLYTVCWAIEEAGSTESEAIAEALRSLDGTQLKTAEGTMTCTDQQVLTKLCLVLQFDDEKTLHTVEQLG